MDSEIQSKKHLPIWAVILAVIVLIAALTVAVMIISGGSPAKKVAQKLELADRYMTELKYEEAVALYNEVIQIEPRNLDAYEGAYKAYTALDRTEEAARILVTLQDMYSKLSDSEKASEFGIRLKQLIDDLTGQHIENGQSTANVHGLCTKTTLYDIDGNVTCNFTYEYDDKGRLIKRTENLFDTEFPDNTVEFEYTDSGALKKATKRSNAQEYDVTVLELKSEDGNLSYYYKQTSSVYWSLIEGTVEYDAAGNGKGVVKASDEKNQVFETYQLECDSAGRITKKQISFGDGREEGPYEYAYDSFGTLTEVKEYNASEDGIKSIEFSFAADGGWTECFKWNGNIYEEYVFYPNGNVQLFNNYYYGQLDSYTIFTYNDTWDTVVERDDFYEEGDYDETHVDTATGVVSRRGYRDGEIIYDSEYEIGLDLFRPRFSFDESERAPFKAFWGYEMVNPGETTGHVTCFDEYLPYLITNKGYFNYYKPVWNEYETDASGKVIKWHKYSLDRKYHIWAEYEYSE